MTNEHNKEKNSDMNEPTQQTSIETSAELGRRKLLKALAISGGAMTLGQLDLKWKAPYIELSALAEAAHLTGHVDSGSVSSDCENTDVAAVEDTLSDAGGIDGQTRQLLQIVNSDDLPKILAEDKKFRRGAAIVIKNGKVSFARISESLSNNSSYVSSGDSNEIVSVIWGNNSGGLSLFVFPTSSQPNVTSSRAAKPFSGFDLAWLLPNECETETHNITVGNTGYELEFQGVKVNKVDVVRLVRAVKITAASGG